MEIVIITVCVFLLYLCFRFFHKQKPISIVPLARNHAISNVNAVQCPLCKTPLLEGRRLLSTVYNENRNLSNYKLCHITGCTICCSKESPQAKMRYCPICKKNLSINSDFLIAHLSQNNLTNRRHLAIMGCNRCYSDNLK